LVPTAATVLGARARRDRYVSVDQVGADGGDNFALGADYQCYLVSVDQVGADGGDEEDYLLVLWHQVSVDQVGADGGDRKDAMDYRIEQACQSIRLVPTAATRCVA